MKKNKLVKVVSYNAAYPTRSSFKPEPQPVKVKREPPKLFSLFTMLFALLMAWFLSSCAADDKKVVIGPDEEIKESAPDDWESTLGVDHPDVEILDGDVSEPEYDYESLAGEANPYDYPEPEYYDEELDVTEGVEQPYDFTEPEPEPEPEYYDGGLDWTIGEEAPYDVPDFVDDAMDDYQVTDGEGLPYDYVEDAPIEDTTDNLPDIYSDYEEGGWQDPGTGTPIFKSK